MTPARRAEFEALVDALEDAVRHHLFNAQSTATRHAARAALTAFVEREEGEEYEVQTVRPEEFNVWEDGTREYYPDLVLRGPHPLRVQEGDRVRVVRVEIGMYDPKNDPPTGGAK